MAANTESQPHPTNVASADASATPASSNTVGGITGDVNPNDLLVKLQNNLVEDHNGLSHLMVTKAESSALIEIVRKDTVRHASDTNSSSNSSGNAGLPNDIRNLQVTLQDTVSFLRSFVRAPMPTFTRGHNQSNLAANLPDEIKLEIADFATHNLAPGDSHMQIWTLGIVSRSWRRALLWRIQGSLCFADSREPYQPAAALYARKRVSDLRKWVRLMLLEDVRCMQLRRISIVLGRYGSPKLGSLFLLTKLLAAASGLQEFELIAPSPCIDPSVDFGDGWLENLADCKHLRHVSMALPAMESDGFAVLLENAERLDTFHLDNCPRLNISQVASNLRVLWIPRSLVSPSELLAIANCVEDRLEHLAISLLFPAAPTEVDDAVDDTLEAMSTLGEGLKFLQLANSAPPHGFDWETFPDLTGNILAACPRLETLQLERSAWRSSLIKYLRAMPLKYLNIAPPTDMPRNLAQAATARLASALRKRQLRQLQTLILRRPLQSLVTNDSSNKWSNLPDIYENAVEAGITVMEEGETLSVT